MKKLLFLLLLLPVMATATSKKMNRDGTPVIVDSYNVNNSVRTDDHSIDVASESASESASTSMSESASESAASNGDQISTNSSRFYALSLQFPGLSGCFTGVQGGVEDHKANKGTSGFLGFNLLNNSCWMEYQAGKERDIELNARLLCNDKKYRRALGYDAKEHGLSKRVRCINLKKASGQAEMQELVDEITQLQENNTALMEEHALIVEECEAANDRGDERLEKCEARNIGMK